MYFIWNKKKSVWYNLFQGTSVSITFYIFVHFQLWMMDSKVQRVFFPKTPKLCVWHTEVRNCYHFKLVSHFQLWFPIWGVLANRLKKPEKKAFFAFNEKTNWKELTLMSLFKSALCSKGIVTDGPKISWLLKRTAEHQFTNKICMSSYNY